MYHSRRCLIEFENIDIPLTYVLFSEFLYSSVSYHRLYLVQRVEVRCSVFNTILVDPSGLLPWEHVPVISKPSFCHHADVLRHLLVSQPALMIHLHRFSDRPLHRRNYLRLQLPVHISPFLTLG